MLHMMQQAAKGEVHEAQINRARKLWKLAYRFVDMSADTGVPASTLKRWVAENPELFPPRTQPVDRIVFNTKTDPEGISSVKHLGPAYLPLAGSVPVSLEERDGCQWPIDLSGANPLTSTEKQLFCNLPKMAATDDHKSPVYCACHCRLGYRVRG